MALRDMVRTYKKEILVAILSASITGVITLWTGLYNLAKTVEVTQQKELRNTLRRDLRTLKAVDKDLERNLSLLLNQSFVPDIEFRSSSDPFEKISDKAKGPEVKALFDALREFWGLQSGVVVTKWTMPKELFSTAAYFPRPDEEIDFDVSQELSDFYKKLNAVNTLIIEIANRTDPSTRFVTAASANRVKQNIDEIKALVSEISKDKILAIKNKVRLEIMRLEREFSKPK